ncbi:MAG: DUF1848 domain-containing protein [Gemmatimonadales bacterium]
MVSASYRCDIPAFYGDWFRARLAAGYAIAASPYGGGPYRVSLRPQDVDGFIFWTRNAGPFLPVLDALSAEGRPFMVQFTLTGYPRALESAVPAAETALAQIRGLAQHFGRRAVVWRYDPLVVSELTPPDWHLANFARLAEALKGSVDEVVFSFAQIYAKTRRNLDAAARRHGFAWQDPDEDEKRALLARLAEIAGEMGLTASLCAQPTLLSGPIRPAACIDAGRLSDLAGRPIDARRKGNRPGCDCHESRDIGAYDACAQGCVYCYAVSSQARAKARIKAHDPAAERL